MEAIEENQGDNELTGRILSVRLVNLADIEARFTNLAHANHDNSIFQLIFSEVLRPVILGPDDASALAEQGFVPAKPVARLICTPMMIQQLITLLEKELKLFEEQAAEASENNGDADA